MLTLTFFPSFYPEIYDPLIHTLAPVASPTPSSPGEEFTKYTTLCAHFLFLMGPQN